MPKICSTGLKWASLERFSVVVLGFFGQKRTLCPSCSNPSINKYDLHTSKVQENVHMPVRTKQISKFMLIPALVSEQYTDNQHRPQNIVYSYVNPLVLFCWGIYMILKKTFFFYIIKTVKFMASKCMYEW